MENIIGVIASDYKLKENIEKLYPKEVKNKQIIIDLINVDLLEEQGKMLVDKGAKVIIGGGLGYKSTLNTVKIPVIPLNIKLMDLLEALKIASNYSKKIILVLGYEEVDFNYSSWSSILNIKVIEEWFSSKYEIRRKVLKYINEKDNVVIVGSGISCSFAREYNMECVFINASEESIKEAIEYSKTFLYSLKREKFYNEVLLNVLDCVKDGMIAIDTNGKIILLNENAKKILNPSKQQVLNKYIINIFPHMRWLLDSLNPKESNKTKIRNINNLVINTKTILIKVDKQVMGSIAILQDITKIQSLERKIKADLKEKGLTAKYTFKDYIYKDKITEEFIFEAKKIGKTDYTVLIHGESGCGKEVIAQSIHNISNRKNNPFVAINCATICDSLLESELFGYEEGAFTGAKKGGKPGLFELAHGGTVFLDEINSLPLNIQTKLLRVIEEKTIMRMGSDYVIPLDIRIIAATNEELNPRKIENKTFRADLFYRLSSLEINIPALRERKEDIVHLFEYFVNDMLEKNSFNNLNSINKNFKLSDLQINKLEMYDWPGNIRELKNLAQKYIITGKINITNNKDEGVEKFINTENKKYNGLDYKNININIKEINKYVESKVIDMLLEQGLSKVEIANILGISRTSLWKKAQK